MSQNKSTRTKCGKKIKVQGPQNGFCLFWKRNLVFSSLRLFTPNTICFSVSPSPSPPPPQVLQTSLKLSLRLGQTDYARNTSFLSGSKFDVFSSFRGEDTRTNFTDHLYADLVEKRIHTFRDDEELGRGDIICVKLLQAIE